MNNSTSSEQCKLIITVADETNDIVLTALYSLIGLFIIASNVTVMVGLPKIKKHFTRFDRLFILLSVVDISVGLLLMPFNIYLIHKDALGVTCLEVGIKTMINAFTSVMSGLITCLITNDRYLLITNKKFYDKYMTTKCIVGIVITMFLISLLWAIIAVHVSMLAKGFGQPIFFLCFGAFAAFFLVEVIVINIRLFRHLKAAAKVIQQSNRAAPGYKSQVNRTILIISVCLVVAYLPTIIGFAFGSVMALLKKPTDTPSSSAAKFLTWIILPTNLNSGLNSAIFMWRNTAFRRHFKAMCDIPVGSHDVAVTYVA